MPRCNVRKGSGLVGLGHMALEDFLNPRLRHSSYNLVHKLSLFENQHGRYRHYPEPAGCGNVLVSIQFSKGNFALVLLCKRIDDRPYDPAGAAPGSPAVNQGKLVLGHELVERVVGDLYRGEIGR